MKKLRYLIILFLFINYSNAVIQCKPADTGNGTICISDESSNSLMEAGAWNGTPPPLPN